MRASFAVVALLVACDGPAPADAPTMGPEPETPQRPNEAPGDPQERLPPEPVDSEATAPQEPVAQEPTVPSPTATPSATARPMPPISQQLPEMPMGPGGEPLPSSVVTAGSAVVACEPILTEELTYGESGSETVSTYSVYAARLSVPGINRTTLVSAFTDGGGILAVPILGGCEPYDQAGTPCTYSVSNDVPATSSTSDVYLDADGGLVAVCGFESNGSDSVPETVTIYYRYLTQP